MAFGTDVGRGTRICWYTDIGWMMGPWLIYGALINGATICIYDGAPDYPTPDRMWEFCAKHKVEILGISPTLDKSAFELHGDDLPKETRSQLFTTTSFASTGEPWNPAPWWWLFEKVGNSKLPIINYSGGTEIAGGILMGNPLLPIKPCSFPAPCPGMDVDILDEEGKPVEPGKVGELVIKQPWIGMASGFGRRRNAISKPIGRDSKTSGSTATGRCAIRTDTGSSSAAATTRSRSPANASGPRRSRASSSRIRSSPKPPSSASPTKQKALQWSHSASYQAPLLTKEGWHPKPKFRMTGWFSRKN